MKNVIKTSLMLTFSLLSLAGCGNIPIAPFAPANGYSIAADDATASDTGTAATTKELRGPKGKGPGGKGPEGKPGKGGPGGGFGLPPELNLTAEQKTQLAELRPNPPAEVDKAAMDTNRTSMEALRKEINDAFISENFDVTALKAKVEALKPAKPDVDRATEDATRIVKTYNILTPEQRTILETKQAEMAAKVPPVKPTPSPEQEAAMVARESRKIDKLATDLRLSDDQKVRLEEVLEAGKVDKPDFAADEAKRKATHDAINAELKSGNATIESVAAILKANAPTEIKNHEVDQLDRLAKIHDILNAEQRAIFIAKDKGPGNPEGFGPGGHPGPGGPGFKGERGGHIFLDGPPKGPETGTEEQA
jgi:Spy/CpxP family protein refolding chaperone